MLLGILGDLSTKLNYIDVREFLYKFLNIEFNPLGIISVIVQLTVIAWFIYQVYLRFRGTQAERVLKGLILISPLVLLFYIFKLSIITKLIEIFSPTILIGLIVIFAPEFRRVLMQLGGNISLLEYFYEGSGRELEPFIDEVLETLQILSEKRFGAILAFEKAAVNRYYIDQGHTINASFSKELMLTILNPKSPLHDGAVTIKGFSIVSAGVILPMTENPKLDWQYGTRHRAAIGFSEVSDSLCVVVSEETGETSFTYQGKLAKVQDLSKIKEVLMDYYGSEENPVKKGSSFLKHFGEIITLVRPK